MALIKCPECGNDISDQAKSCPNCGCTIKQNPKNKLSKKLVILFITVILILITIFCVKKYNDIQLEKQRIAEEARQEKINQLLIDVIKAYSTADFELVSSYLDQLDGLSYDTTEERTILKYNEEVYPVAHEFYLKIVDADKTIKNRSTYSLNTLMASLREPFNRFDELPIDTQSSLGEYILKVRNNVMYCTFKREFLDNSTTDLDYPLTQGGYFVVLEVYTDELASIDFPCK